MKIPLVAAISLSAISAGAAFAQKEQIGWKDYLGGPDGAHFSPLKQINASNVSKLEVAWTYAAPEGSSVFCPLVVDNIVYISAKGGALVALDATTGKELWVHPFGSGGGAMGGRGGIAGQRGANYWESKDRKDRRILVTSAGYSVGDRRAHRENRRLVRRTWEARSQDRYRSRADSAGLANSRDGSLRT